MAWFGPAGNSPLFYQQGKKSSVEAPEWLAQLGLNAYEYQSGRGVRIFEATARAIGEEGEKHAVKVSMHAPYYINLVREDREGQQQTANHLLKSLRVAAWMKAQRVVFHPGSVGQRDRQQALLLARENLGQVVAQAAGEGLDPGLLSPETTGKQSQLGNLEEVLSLSAEFDLMPTVDFAHLHAASGGGLNDREMVDQVLDMLSRGLPRQHQVCHVHFSRIEFGRAGERRHMTLADTGYGPDFALIAQGMLARGIDATVICESNGSQVRDALTLTQIWAQAERQKDRESLTQ